MRIGIDWGGTKLEVIAIADDAQTLVRKRVPTPHSDYDACIDAVVKLVQDAERACDQKASVGVGIPGTISPASGLVKNANSTWINGKPLLKDLEQALGRKVRIQNDANCFAVSEAVDGAGQNMPVVAGVILGTGCGCGIAINGKALVGRGGIAGEFGHTPLAPLKQGEGGNKPCWCGRKDCLETFVSGTAFKLDYETRMGASTNLSGTEIVALGSVISEATYDDYTDRLARGLSTLVNIIDPDIIVLGGGMSNIERLYEDLPNAISPYVFTDVFDTPIVKAKYGDSSGVRGAAWLW